MPDCIFAPYFPPEEPQKFANVHKIFGASNVSKLLNEVQPHQREDAVNSLAYEAEARIKDPVYGCVGAISVLQRQVLRLQKELDATNADLIRFTTATPPNHSEIPRITIPSQSTTTMATPDRSQPHQIQVHTQHRFETTGLGPQYGAARYGEGGLKSTLFPDRGPSTSQILAVVTGVPIGGTLLALAGFALVGTLIGAALALPLFVLFSPVLVPATIVIGLAVAGFLTSGACALTALSSFSWVMNYIRETQGTVPEQLDSAKRRVADMAGYLGQKTKDVGQKTKEVGQDIQTKAQDAKRS
ncbi:P24 oleosin-like [Senna tora]|uniref:P24 oleosin-like n=1 Tax=Senna tora TaxID=362788 RepID=A0A834TE53_9FABA|nr:P24 oleosin-like [Senna tora]